jgi:hypothetical protein
MLAKVLFLRYDGWLTVEEPDEGPGVVFRVVLPAADPALIPDDEKVPERA